MLTKKIAGRIYNYDYCIGMSGPAGKGFSRPVDFTVAPGPSLFVISRGNMNGPGQGITKCTLNHELIWEDRGLNFGGRQCRWPRCVAVDSNENAYISDDYNSAMFMYDVDGNFQGKWGRKGSGDGELNSPYGLAFDKEDNLFVVDSVNCRIQKFTRHGTFLAKWGRKGSGQGEFNLPWGIAIDKQGDVYVADWKNGRVQKFSPEGEYLTSFGGPGTGEGELQLPSDVSVDDEGDVYVADWSANRLIVYASDGSFITGFGGDAAELSRWAQNVIDANPDYLKARQRADLKVERGFSRPSAVNVDAEGRIMVNDSQRCRIQIYVKEQKFVDAQFNL